MKRSHVTTTANRKSCCMCNERNNMTTPTNAVLDSSQITTTANRKSCYL